MTTRADPHSNEFDGTPAQRAALHRKMRELGITRKRNKKKIAETAATLSRHQATNTPRRHEPSSLGGRVEFIGFCQERIAELMVLVRRRCHRGG